jgi:glycosyltransferase involved in cell wall biosynthesis
MTGTAEPLYPEVGVIKIASDDWTNQWMVRHHIAARLSRYFKVLWMQPAEYWRVALKSREAAKVHIPYQDKSGFMVYSPSSLLPHVYRPKAVSQWLFSQRIREARKELLRRGCKKIVLFLWRPEFYPALHEVSHDASFYHIEDEYSFSASDGPVDPLEAKMIAGVDHCFILSPAMMEKKGHINPATTYEPGGVDFAWYSQNFPEPGDLAKIPHPRVGYTGHLKKQLDWQLLLDLATKHSGWSFVLVGPKSPHPEIQAIMERLAARPNVHFLGGKTSVELAAYPQHFDVCIMPYVNDAYTRYIYPLKLHEYLASGTPIVATPIRSLQEYNRVMELPVGTEQWSRALERTLRNSKDPIGREERRSLARNYDWDLVTERIARVMAGRLGPEYLKHFPEQSRSAESQSIGSAR